MKLKVHTSQVGTGLSVQGTFDVNCGQGHQIIQWLGHVACSRLSYANGHALGCYVPQSVVDKDGKVLDIDLVINEVAADGDEMYVEYSEGPSAYRVRWEGRPKTPPFQWSAEGAEVVVAHDAWLTAWDLQEENLGALQEPELVQQNPEGALRDLHRVKSVLMQYAGALQMLLLQFTSEASSPIDSIQRMTLAQFKALLHAAKVTTPPFPVEQLDELFTTVLGTPGAQARRTANQSGQSVFELPELMVALVHVASNRFSAGSFLTGTNTTPLSTKLLSLLQDCISAHLFPELQRKVEKLHGSFTPRAQLLLRKGRRLTEQVLERCQVKRVKSRVLRVDWRHICKHLQRWGLLGKEIMLPELVPVVVFAMQMHSDLYRFVLHPQPLALDYDQFEKLLLGLAHLLAWARKKGDAFEEFLGELLDNVYKRAGVLLELPLNDGEASGGKGAAQLKQL